MIQLWPVQGIQSGKVCLLVCDLKNWTSAVSIGVLLNVSLTVSLTASCSTPRRQKSKVLTDLGADNEAVAARFERYKSKTSHCAPVPVSQAGYRVILAGFGPFSGVSLNTSSLVAMNFADLIDPARGEFMLPALKPEDADGIVRQGIVMIDGVRVAVCAVTASVIWDLAAAIYLHEAGAFRPDLLIMAGMDGGNANVGTWEHHATNVAAHLHGYEHDGSSSSVTPKIDDELSGDTIILPAGPDSLPMTWNSPNITAMTRPIVRERFPGFDVRTSDEETPGKYLCNNVSYVVLAGLAGYELPLAGGMMNVKVNGLSATKAGFFHYPWTSGQDKGAIATWVKVIEAAIKSEMGR
jgi:pyrrolidone-carboxylate peptidase